MTGDVQLQSLPSRDAPERRMFEALNAERRMQGLTPVAWSSELGLAAARHSADMARNGFLDHDGSDGSSPDQRAARVGYVVPPGTGWLVIEAISAMPSMEAALNWLLSDGVHRRVLMKPVWREVGIGYVAGGPLGNYWTLDFGCRPNVLPVFGRLVADGKLSLTLTNEGCAPQGNGSSQMGRAVEVALSASPEPASWEPFDETKQIARPSDGTLHVRLRDSSGRLSMPVRLSLEDLEASSSPMAPTPTPTTAPTRQPTATRTPSATPTATATTEPTPTATATPTPEPEEQREG